jgi:hypothetical protein
VHQQRNAGLSDVLMFYLISCLTFFLRLNLFSMSVLGQVMKNWEGVFDQMDDGPQVETFIFQSTEEKSSAN